MMVLISYDVSTTSSAGRTRLRKVAKELNTTGTVICGYESGRRIIATPFLYQICHKYHVSADYLLGRIDENSQK